MKKRVLVFAMALIFCSWITANADVVTFDSKSNMLKVTYDKCLPEAVYAFICTTSMDDELNLSDGQVFFLQQIKADVTGTIRAAIVGQASRQYSFWLGGEFADGKSPVKIGSYNANTQRLPESLKYIDEEAFMGTPFQILYLEDGITHVGARAFMNCSLLSFVYIPQSVTTIGEDAFSGCPNLTICCQTGSAAYQYASEHGIPVEIR